MNYSIIRNIIGKFMMFMSLLMLFPLGVSIIYKENITNLLAFIIPIGVFLIGGKLLSFTKNKNKSFGAREGFIIVALIWVLMSLIGCLPFIISKEIPNFFDAFLKLHLVLPQQEVVLLLM